MESDETKYIFRMYEKAVEGRNLRYQNYNAWTNLYAIFTGAFFIAYYTVENSDYLLASIVSILGYVTAICWLYSLSGYYAWIGSWIKLLHRYETAMHGRFGTWFAYKYADEGLKKDSGFPQNFSTQRITGVFISFVIIGWAVMVTKEIHRLLSYCIGLSAFISNDGFIAMEKLGSSLLHAVIASIVPFVIYGMLRLIFRSICRSSIEYMTTEIDKDNSRKERGRR